jgi:hypothetical protein
LVKRYKGILATEDISAQINYLKSHLPPMKNEERWKSEIKESPKEKVIDNIVELIIRGEINNLEDLNIIKEDLCQREKCNSPRNESILSRIPKFKRKMFKKKYSRDHENR